MPFHDGRRQSPHTTLRLFVSVHSDILPRCSSPTQLHTVVSDLLYFMSWHDFSASKYWQNKFMIPLFTSGYSMIYACTT